MTLENEKLSRFHQELTTLSRKLEEMKQGRDSTITWVIFRVLLATTNEDYKKTLQQTYFLLIVVRCNITNVACVLLIVFLANATTYD